MTEEISEDEIYYLEGYAAAESFIEKLEAPPKYEDKDKQEKFADGFYDAIRDWAG